MADMIVLNVDPNNATCAMRGECPHCQHPAYFRPINTHARQAVNAEGKKVAGTTESLNTVECQNCGGAVLLVARRADNEREYTYAAHYPMGKPNDDVPAQIPSKIAIDFKEALRCQFVKAHRATATMCRRSLQSSCHDLQATGTRLIEQVDALASSGRITSALKDMAHQVRLVGNIGAHPDKDGLEDVTEEDARDILEFAREFFDHVYVMPAKLEAMKKRRANPAP